MKKILQRVLFTLVVAVFVSCFSGNVWAGSSASSIAGSSSKVKATFNGYTTNNNNPVANAGASSQSNSGVKFNSNPAARAQSLAVGGTALAQGGSVKIDSHAVNNNKYVNRQFLPAGMDSTSETMQYFGKWNIQPWNVFPPVYGKWKPTGNKQMDIHYDKMWIHLYHKLPPVKGVNFVKFGAIRDGVLVASATVRVGAEQGTDDAQAIIAAIARKNGGNYVEILASSAVQEPTAKGWHVGTGMGATGVIGSNEKAGISGAGGTGYGKSSIRMEFLPYMQVRIWRDGKVEDGKKIQPAKNQQSFKDHGKQWLINKKTK